MADDEDLDSLSGLLKLPHVAVNILRVSELIRRADDVAQHLFRRGDGGGGGQMVHQLGGEETLRGVLADLRRVAVIILLLRAEGKRAQQCEGRNAHASPSYETQEGTLNGQLR